MSELHIEISELIAAGVNVSDPEETLRIATARGYQLVVRVIEYDPTRFLTMVAAWFEQEVVA
ncbi:MULTISPECIES: cell division protein [Actinomycetes]|uniref:Cell division protein n=1 Tax=Corynebacterium silvaticum TaxID=2320431 RepID=A0A7Y4LHR7_9CORY|nr:MULTISPECIES: cell division protein [Actinomycetes]ARU45724.1 cell division protein [Corynebacterium silvaticum]NON70310.1 cell division protein [Corynebacterium silvaticum]UWH00839.1 cell division protein [Corynebacterium silvaticum]UWH02887.1 cell division protein [Corynebacterium silvaticum]UWH04926.1 cell division protein [Corynebacterium silvaticum]